MQSMFFLGGLGACPLGKFEKIDTRSSAAIADLNFNNN